MTLASKKRMSLLFIGDFLVLALSLWITLFVRYAAAPSAQTLYDHFTAFLPLLLIWILVFFISGLYEKHTVIFKTEIPLTLFRAQLVNAGLAVIFFYLAPYLPIAPKTVLLLYVVISSLALLVWRTEIFPRFSNGEGKEKAVIIGAGAETEELKREINSGNYSMKFVSSIDLDHADNFDFQTDVVSKVYSDDISVVVIDLEHKKADPIVPQLYNLIFSKVRFIDMHRVYEEVFGRVGLSLLNHSWFLENISATPKYLYDVAKRLMDILIALPLSLISFILYPFVALAIKIEDRGPIFIVQERIGKENKIIKIPKFRSMKTSDKGLWVVEKDDRITKVGKVLRRMRIDELPQLLSVIKGDLSLVGPRPDIYDLGMKLSREIPYYSVRSLIHPGLSGWAQIRQENPPQSLEETKMRLAYDFYYIKHRSFFLDLKIALQTIRTLLSRAGK
jgi:exopolysaccharide biosynthesis polyprenyl glycosylphosphotransferase